MRVADAVVERVRGGRVEAHALARALVARLADVEDASVVIVQRCPDCGGAHGRPVVMAPAAARGIGVSIAHAGGEHVVAAVRGGRIGVDAERLDAQPGRAAAIGELLGASDDPLREWTRVEAVLKADGRGLRVDPAAVRAAGGLSAAPGSDRRYEVLEVDLGAELVVSVAIERDQPADEIS